MGLSSPACYTTKGLIKPEITPFSIAAAAAAAATAAAAAAAETRAKNKLTY